MKLYYMNGTVSIAVMIALKEANLPFEAIKVDFAAKEQTSPEYLAVNPKGRVPALVTNEGVITETGALLDYVSACAPEAGLTPADPFQAAKMRELMYYLASTWHVNHAHKGRGNRWADRPESLEDMRAKSRETVKASCDYVEANLLKGPYLLGEKFTLADAYLYVVTGWLKGDGVDVSDYPKLSALRAEMEKRPSVQSIIADGML